MEFIVKNKNNYLGKTVLKMRSQIERKISYVSAKQLLEKSAKTKKKNKKNNHELFKIFGGFSGQN